MNYAEQIAEFHKRKGLTGKRLRRAVLHDTIRAKHYGTSYAKRYFCNEFDSSSPLISLFSWTNTPEGIGYWGQRSV